MPANEFTLFVATPTKLAVPSPDPKLTVNNPDVVSAAVWLIPEAPAVNPTVVPLYAALMAIAPDMAVMLVGPEAVIASLNVTVVPLNVKALTLVPATPVVITPASVTLTL